jgi:hypothetical protein
MTDQSIEAGIITVLILRLERERLPMVLDIKAKVDRGERLGDWDIVFLEEGCIDARRTRPLLNGHHEYDVLVANVIHLYKMITDKALENEIQTQAHAHTH